MKTFYASLITFFLLLSLIIYNGSYVKRTTAELETLLSEHTQMPAGTDALQKTEDVWQKSKKVLSLSVSFEEMREIDEQLLSMRAAVTADSAADFEKARLLAMEALARIRESEELSIDNLI